MLRDTKPRESLPHALKIFVRWSIGLTLASWLEAIVAHLRGLPKPYSWPYYWTSGDRFFDFEGFQERFAHFSEGTFFSHKYGPFPYPAPLVLCYRFLFALWGQRPHSIRIFFAFCGIAFFIAIFIFYLALRKRGISKKNSMSFLAATAIFSYPAYFILQRGNIEIFVWVAMAGMAAALSRKALRWTAFFLGVAIAFKWYPVLFCGIFLYRDRLKYIAISAITAVGTTFGAAFLVGPTTLIALKETQIGMRLFLEFFTLHYKELGYDHSFFAAIKVLAHAFHPNVEHLLSRYMLCAAVAATFLYFARIRRLSMLTQFIVLSLLAVTLPPTSYDYTLLELYFAWGFYALYLIDSRNLERHIHADAWTMFWFAMAFTPQGYVILRGVRFGAEVRMIALSALLYLFLRYPLYEAIITQTSDELV